MAAMILPRFLWGYVKDSALLPPLPQELPQLRRRDIVAIPEINRDMLQRVWAEMAIGVTSAVLQRADTYSIYEVRKKKPCRVFLSICRSHITILSAIEVDQFCEMCQGIVNNPLRFRSLQDYMPGL
jgi:hypothetical protein